MKTATDQVCVLVIPSWYPTKANPIAGSFFKEQATLLQQRYDLRVLFGISRPVSYRLSLKKWHWLPRRGLAKILANGDGTILDRKLDIGFEYLHRSRNDLALLEASIDAYRQMLGRIVLEGWKPSILHAQCTWPAGIIAAKLAGEFNIPWVITENQVFASTIYSPRQWSLMMAALKGATRLIAVSQHQLRCIFLQGIYRNIDVVGNLIDEKVFQFAEPRSDRSRFRILAVTYPSPYKDIETFFRAIALLVERGHVDIEVDVIGNNSWGDLLKATTVEYERLAVKFGVAQVCRFIVTATRQEMPNHIADCDLFVSTSVAETYGIAVREAMTVGRPVVCTGSGGVEDDLSTINGIKVDIGDHEAVADAIIAVKTGLIRFNSEAVRNSIITRHGRQAFLDQMSMIYEGAMASGPLIKKPMHERPSSNMVLRRKIRKTMSEKIHQRMIR